MKRREILKAVGGPLFGPGYGAPPYRMLDRAVLAVRFESDADIIRAALPEPLEPDGAAVSVRFATVTESPFGEFSSCSVFLTARLKRKSVAFCHSLTIDQDEPIFANREIWGFPATRGDPELIVGENRATGFLDLGYGQHFRASIPMTEENDTDPASATTLVTCKLIPGANGKPAIAQLVGVTASDVTIREAWTGRPQLEVPGGRLFDIFPVGELLSGVYIREDMTLPPGRVLHDYLAGSGKR